MLVITSIRRCLPGSALSVNLNSPGWCSFMRQLRTCTFILLSYLLKIGDIHHDARVPCRIWRSLDAPSLSSLNLFKDKSQTLCLTVSHFIRHLVIQQDRARMRKKQLGVRHCLLNDYSPRSLFMPSFSLRILRSCWRSRGTWPILRLPSLY